MATIQALVDSATAYAVCGLAFAAAFLTMGIHRVDQQAKGSGIAFRLIIFPGVAALWPLLLIRWIRGGSA